MNHELPPLNELDKMAQCINWADRNVWVQTYIACGRAYHQDEQVFNILQRHSSACYTNKAQDSRQERYEFFKSSLSNSGLGIGTVIHYARQGGYKAPEKDETTNRPMVSAVDLLKVDVDNVFHSNQRQDTPETLEVRALTSAVDKARAVLNYWVFASPSSEMAVRLEFLSKNTDYFKLFPLVEKECFELLNTYCTSVVQDYDPNDFLRWAEHKSATGRISQESVRAVCEETTFIDVINAQTAARYFDEAVKQAWMWHQAIAARKASEAILTEAQGPDFDKATSNTRDIINRLGAGATQMDSGLLTLKDIEIVTAGALSLRESISPDQENSRFIPTGYPEIDEHIKGYSRGEVTIMAAHSGTGKTWFGIDVMRKMAEQGKKVVFFSTEMSPAALSERFILNVSERSLNELIKANASPAGDVPAGEAVITSMQFVQAHGGITFVGSRANGLSISQISSTLTSMALQNQVDVVVIDYLQDIQNDIVNRGKVQNWEKVVDTMGQLRRLAAEFNLPVLALAQLNNPNRGNNNGKSKMPGLYDIADASYVVRDAAAVLIMYNVATEESTTRAAPEEPQANTGPINGFFGTYSGGIGSAPPSPEGYCGTGSNISVSTRLSIAKSRHGENTQGSMLVKRTAGSRFNFISQGH